MSEKAVSANSSLDAVKWVVVAVLVVAGVYGNSYFASESMLLRVVGLLVLAGIAGYIAAQTAKGKAFIKLGLEARTEIRKVVWPTRQEAIRMTWVVMVVVTILSLLLGGFDYVIQWLVQLFLSR